MPRPASDLRERILDVALDRFNEEGYDKTSLREIAEQLGVTKAALYYHFKNKADILLALHLRLHDLGGDLLAEIDGLDDAESVAARWPALIDGFIDQVLANHDLFLVHQRNRRAFESIAESKEHQLANDDLEERFRRVLANQALPLDLRVRMAAAIGAIMTTLMGGPTGVFGDESPERVAGVVRRAACELVTSGRRVPPTGFEPVRRP